MEACLDLIHNHRRLDHRRAGPGRRGPHLGQPWSRRPEAGTGHGHRYRQRPPPRGGDDAVRGHALRVAGADADHRPAGGTRRTWRRCSGAGRSPAAIIGQCDRGPCGSDIHEGDRLRWPPCPIELLMDAPALHPRGARRPPELAEIAAPSTCGRLCPRWPTPAGALLRLLASPQHRQQALGVPPVRPERAQSNTVD